jgi:hypothetical protein
LKKPYGNHHTHFVISGGGGGGLEPEENDHTFTMDTVISKYHYILFDLNTEEADLKVYDRNNDLIWSDQINGLK